MIFKVVIRNIMLGEGVRLIIMSLIHLVNSTALLMVVTLRLMLTVGVRNIIRVGVVTDVHIQLLVLEPVTH